MSIFRFLVGTPFPSGTKLARARKKHKRKQPYTQTRWFAVTCVTVTILFIVYRIFLLGAATGASQALLGDKQQNLICNQGANQEAGLQNNGLATLDAAYQQRVSSQKALGPNLITDAAIDDYNPNIGSPNGYARTQETAQLDYQYLDENNQHFLRVIDSGGTQPDGHGGWVANLVAIAPHTTYAYSFMYRSSVRLQAAIEYVNAAGIHSYRNITQLPAQSEWHQFTAHFDNDIDAQTFRFTVTSVAAGQFDMKQYDVHQIASAELQQGAISLAFDDGWESFATKAEPLLKKYKMPSTAYIITDIAQKGEAGYMTMGTVQKMHKNGVEIGSHSLTHCDQTKLSSKDVAANAKNSKSALEAAHVGAITSFAYPYGSYNDTTNQIYARTFSYLRSSDVGYNDRYFDPQNIHSIAVLNTTILAQLQSYIDYAATHHVWLVLAYHRIDEQGGYNITDKQFEQQLQLIQKSKLPVKTMGDAASSIK